MEPAYIDFAFVKAHADVRVVLAHYGVAVPQHSTKSIKIRCLFHAEKHASLSMSLERKIFHCFGCGEGGDIIALVARKENVDLRAAARLIADLSGIACAPARSDGDTRPARSRPPTAAKAAAKPHNGAAGAATAATAPVAQTCNPEPPDAPQAAINPPLTLRLKLDHTHPYLAARNLSPETIATFGLGYASRGLLKGRIAIPIHNEAGELIAYAGRWPGEDGWPEDEDKYKLPKGFEKRHVLFNLNRLLNESGQVEGGHVLLVEGYVAAMQLFARGFPVVALMGRYITDEQIALLERVGVSHLTLMLDGDTPGRESAERLIPLLAKSFFVRDVVLPEGLEPEGLDPATLRSLVC